MWDSIAYFLVNQSNYCFVPVIQCRDVWIILFIGQIMEFIVCIFSLFAILFVSKNQIDPVVQIETDRLGLQQFSMSFNEIVTWIKFKNTHCWARKEVKRCWLSWNSAALQNQIVQNWLKTQENRKTTVSTLWYLTFRLLSCYNFRQSNRKVCLECRTFLLANVWHLRHKGWLW